MKFALIPLFVFLFLNGCLTGNKESNEVKTKWTGIYEVTRHTENTEGCEGEGLSISDSLTDNYFAVFNNSIIGQKYVQILSCDSMQTCSETVAEFLDYQFVVYDFEFTFFIGSDGSGYTGEVGFTGFNRDGVCTDGRLDKISFTKGTNDTLILKKTSYPAPDFPPDSDGFCMSDKAAEAARSQPCSAYTIIKGIKAADL